MPADHLAGAYFDTSVLVKAYVAETGTREAVRLLGRYRVLTSAVAPVELASAVRRLRRQRRLSRRHVELIEARADQDRASWTLLALDGDVLARAEAVTRAASVTTLDALHLASALAFQASTGLRPPFITSDGQQRRAGAALGLDVVFIE